MFLRHTASGYTLAAADAARRVAGDKQPAELNDKLLK